MRRQEDGPAGQAVDTPGPSASADFHIRPGETYEEAMRRAHNAAQERFEQEYVQRQQLAYALANVEREREHMSQYGRELKAGVDAGQRREQEWLQALLNAELARGQDMERHRLQTHYDAQLQQAAVVQQRELQAQYDRELEEERARVQQQAGVQNSEWYQQQLAAGQQGERERLQAEYDAELQRAAEVQRRELQAQYDHELAEERARVQRDVGNQHTLAMEGMHNEQWQQERAHYLQQIGDNQQLPRDRDREMFQQHVEHQQHLEQEREQWQQQRQLLDRRQADLQAQLQVQHVQLQQQPHYALPGGPGGPGGPPLPPPFPPAPPAGPGGPAHHGGGPQAHREEVPTLGDKTSTTMPAIREYLVYKKKVELWLAVTGYAHRYALQRLLLKLGGRVAEYIMLTLTPPDRDREDGVWAFLPDLTG